MSFSITSVTVRGKYQHRNPTRTAHKLTNQRSRNLRLGMQSGVTVRTPDIHLALLDRVLNADICMPVEQCKSYFNRRPIIVELIKKHIRPIYTHVQQGWIRICKMWVHASQAKAAMSRRQNGSGRPTILGCDFTHASFSAF